VDGRERIYKKIRAAAKKRFTGARGSHGWEHTERVLKLAEHIARREGASLFTVKTAAVLHDIARSDEDKSSGRIDHARLGAEKAFEICVKAGLGPVEAGMIAHCVAAHRFRGRIKPVTKEAKVIFDADKLDSIGAVGIGRAFLFAGEAGAKLHNKGINISRTKPYTAEDTAYREYVVKLRNVKACMLTKEGKKMARSRHVFMEAFFKRLDKEVDGSI